MKIYVASSWRNQVQQRVVNELRGAGHEVYDFRKDGFSWASIDPNWQDWEETEFLEGLSHPIAREGYKRDMEALAAADAVVLVLPSGRSSHLEAGWAVGQGKPLVILAFSPLEPELMYRMANAVEFTIADIAAWLKHFEENVRQMTVVEPGYSLYACSRCKVVSLLWNPTMILCDDTERLSTWDGPLCNSCHETSLYWRVRLDAGA